MLPTLFIVIERWWIRDSFCPPDYAWRALIYDQEHGITSAADATPWMAIARAGAYLALKRHGAFQPSQAQEDLEQLVRRASALAHHDVPGLEVAVAQASPRAPRRARGMGTRPRAAARRGS